MLLLQSLIPMTRTLDSVTVAGMFAIVPMVLFPRIRLETYVLHTHSSSVDSMDPACLGPLAHAVSICFGSINSLLNMMKLAVASQNIFLGSPGVYTGTTNIKLFRGAHA